MKYDSTEDTKKHILTVRGLILQVSKMIIERGEYHDSTKLEEPEKAIFDEYTPKLAGCTYGSDEYKEFLAGMKPGLDHHYAQNPHHPEFHKEGIIDMSLLDIIEMLMDWKAATLRHNDGDIMKSLEINQGRFGYSDELKSILKNTIKEMKLG